ncbi:MAG TPA: hypothetical protein VF281_00745 [Candidatus Saccharimonadales bacterium]
MDRPSMCHERLIVSSIIVPKKFATVELVLSIPTKEMLAELTPEQQAKVEDSIRHQTRSLLQHLEEAFLDKANLDDFLNPENANSSLELLDQSNH